MTYQETLDKQVQCMIEEFQTLSTSSLVLISKNYVRINEIAGIELASRGLDMDGKWTGYQR